MTLRKKVILSMLVAISLAVTTTGVVFYRGQLLNEALRTEAFVGQVIKGTAELNYLTQGYALNPNERYKTQWRERHASLIKLLRENGLYADDEKAVQMNMLRDLETIGGLFEKIVSNYDSSGKLTGIMRDMRLESNARLSAQLTTRTQSMNNDATLLAQATNQKQSIIQTRVFVIILSLCLAMVAVIVYIALVLTRSVVGGLLLLEEGTRAISNGDLDYKINIQRNDEIGNVAVAFNEMSTKLQNSHEELLDLTNQLASHRDELRNLASELVIAEERERKRVAGVLHDEVAQTLAAARMKLDLLRDIPSDQRDRTVGEAKALLVQSIQETRELMNDLGNPLLFELGLQAACEALANRLMERHPVRIHCDIRDAFKHLNPDVKMIIYQVFRELLNNVVKHGHAQNAHVMIDLENGHFRVTVTDDGVGFDPQMLGAPTGEGGFGLYSIRERLIAIDGSLKIDSSPGSGTVVTALLPAALD
jgi:signal transduction histidine kinase